MARQCPFVKSVTRGMFKQSDITLKEAITACPYMQRQNKFSLDIKSPQTMMLSKGDLACPYTSGTATKGSVCPLTGIDVRRAAHSQVIDSIDKTIAPPKSCPFDHLAIQRAVEDEHRDRACGSWKEQIGAMLKAKKSNKTYREFKRINKNTDDPCRVDEVTNFKAFTDPKEIFCSNDYLNMSTHPQVIRASQHAAEVHGVGAGGTRNISGNSELTERLEMELASWHGKEDALLFQSCYVANHATLSTLLGKGFPDSQCFSDSGNHASMIQGMLDGRNQHEDKAGRVFQFQHNNLEQLEEMLYAEHRKQPDVLRIVAFESVHSMNGNIQSVGEICDIAHKYGAITFCDEVHAIGLYGQQGGGIGELDDIQHKIDIVSGTLGKGVGGIGGYITAHGDLVDVIRQYAPGFIFTTATPPTTIAANYASIRLLKGIEGEQFRQDHFDAVDILRGELDRAGIEYKRPRRASHVTAVPLGSAEVADVVMEAMSQKGYYVQAIKHPTVPMGDEMLRLTVSPQHLRHPSTITRFIKNLSDTLRQVHQYQHQKHHHQRVHSSSNQQHQ